MPLCKKCGTKLVEGAKFCFNCGDSTESNTNSSKREFKYDGIIHKCPNCGEVLNSFISNCPSCKFELRDTQNSYAIREFASQLLSTNNEQKKAEIIRNFPVPNNKENVFEFMILASTNISGKTDSEISDAWLAKLDQVMSKAKMILNPEELAMTKKQYQDILRKVKKEKSLTNAKKFGGIMAESIPFIPQFCAVFFWILSIIVLLFMFKNNSINGSVNAFFWFIILDFAVGAYFIPYSYRCGSILPKLVTTAGIIMNVAIIFTFCQKEMCATHVFLMIFQVACIVGLVFRTIQMNKDTDEHNLSFNIGALVLTLISLIVWLIVFIVGSYMGSRNIIDKKTPIISGDVSTDEQAGIYTYKVKNYVGKNAASIGTMYGHELIDNYGEVTVRIVFVTAEGMLILPDDDDEKKKYVVAEQNIKAGTDISIVHQKESDGEISPYCVDYQSYDEIVLYLTPIGTEYKPQIKVAVPTLDKHIYHIKNYCGRNAASFGEFYGSDRVDKYGIAELKIVFMTEGGTYVDYSDINELKKFIVVGQDIDADTEFKITYDKGEDGRESYYLINYQQYEEITLTVKRLEKEIIDQLPNIKTEE